MGSKGVRGRLQQGQRIMITPQDEIGVGQILLGSRCLNQLTLRQKGTLGLLTGRNRRVKLAQITQHHGAILFHQRQQIDSYVKPLIVGAHLIKVVQGRPIIALLTVEDR